MLKFKLVVLLIISLFLDKVTSESMKSAVKNSSTELKTDAILGISALRELRRGKGRSRGKKGKKKRSGGGGGIHH